MTGAVRLAAAEGFEDIAAALRRGHVTLTLGWQDIATRYRRSRIGPFWLTINKGVLIAALSLVFGNLFQLDMPEFIPYLAIGLILWTYIAAALGEGCTAFIDASGTILQVRMPLSTHVGLTIYRNLLILAHNLLIIPLVLLVFLRPVGWDALLAIPGLILLTVNLLWIALVLAVVCARYRDVTEIVGNVLQVSFYLTPIIWTEALLRARVDIPVLDFNPFYHFLTIVRSPLLGTPTTLLNWVIPLVMAVVGWAFAIAFFGRYRRRVAYWL